MPEAQSTADSIVFRSISAAHPLPEGVRQDLPSLDLIGAAIARAARLAAAEHRAQRSYSLVRRSQAAELLRLARKAAHAAVHPHVADDASQLLPPTCCPNGYVWRFHPAPQAAGAPIASHDSGAIA